MIKTGEVYIYAQGICHCSVCAPSDMDSDAVEEHVNAYYPSGISSKWEIDSNGFADGTKSPCECNENADRKHWLMVC